MKISVIISSMGRKFTLGRLLVNISNQTLLPNEIIIIEAGAERWSPAEFPKSLADNICVTYAPAMSLAAARSKGQQLATGDLLIFIDDDIIMPMSYIAESCNFLQSNPLIVAVGGCYTDDGVANRSRWSLGIGRLLGVYGDGSRNRIMRNGWLDYVRGKNRERISSADWLFGCNSVIRAQAFDHPDIHFETDMAAWSFLEDGYFYSKVIKAFGDCVRILPRLAVIHAPLDSSGNLSKITVRMRILYRYIFWRDQLSSGKISDRLRFDLGMLANVLLMFKMERHPWIILECLKTCFFYSRNKQMNWIRANEYIFTQN